MGQIQSSVGLITGIGIDETVSKLMAVAGRPRDLLVNRNKALQSQQAAVNELLALTIGVQISTDRLGRVSEFNTISASSSDKEVLTATATSKATPGTYRFQTVQTAQSSAFTSNALNSSSQELSAGELTLRTGGFVDGSTTLDSLRGGQGISNGKIQITDRSGESRIVDLRFAVTIEDVVEKINTTSGLKIVAKTEGDRIVLTDVSGSTSSNLKIEDVDGGSTATELGLGGVNVASNSVSGDDLVYLGNATQIASLRDGRGLRFGKGDDLEVTLRDGTVLNADLNDATKGNPITIGQLVDRINAIDDDKLLARISADGNSLELVDLTSGSSQFSVSSPNGSLAEDLGLSQSTPSGTITGTRVQSGLSGPLLKSLRGGQGIGSLGLIGITNRQGTTTNVDLSTAISLRDVVTQINGANAGVVASLNASKTGILIQDTTGSSASNLKVVNADGTNAATKLQIAADVAKNSIDTGSLGLQFIHENTTLASLNQGRGISLGSIRFTDSKGAEATLNLVQKGAKTVGDILDAINALNIDVEAKLNESGDGFYVVDTAGGTGSLTIADIESGKGASSLGIAGTSKTLTIGGIEKKGIEASQNLVLKVESGDRISDVVANLNTLGGPVRASLLNAGPNSVRVLLNSRQSGVQGRVFVDGGATGLSFTASSQARDAVVSIGSSENSGGILVSSSSNTFKEIVTGVQITVEGVSSEPVEVTVSSSASAVEKNVQAFVDQFNKVFDKLKTFTKFDAATKSTGILFGSSEALRTEYALTRFISSRVSGAGRIKSFEQIGISLEADGKLDFDKSKFQALLESDQQAVEEFFTKAETGFSARAKKVIDTISGENKSLLVSRNESLQRQVDVNTKRIESMNARLERNRTRMLNQFYKLEESIAKLQKNQKEIGKIGTLTV